MDRSLERMLGSIQHNIEKKTKNRNKQAGKDTDYDVSKNSVTKSNALVRAYYRFGLVEKRIMEALISRLHPMRTDNEFQDIELTAKSYAKAFTVSEKIAYRDLEKAVQNLMRRVISVSGEDIEGRIEFTLMSHAQYLKHKGKVVCSFNPKIVPHLVGMKSKFTKYPLSKAVGFNSSYSWRFYELLISWAKPKHETKGLLAGWFTIEVTELRNMLSVPKSYTWTRFREMVLDVAQSELEEKTNIQMTLETQKTGKKITHLKIQFIENTQLQMKFDRGGKNSSLKK